MVTQTKVKFRAVGSCIAATTFLALVAAILLKMPPFAPPGPAQQIRPSQVSLMVPDLVETLRWYEGLSGSFGCPWSPRTEGLLTRSWSETAMSWS